MVAAAPLAYDLNRLTQIGTALALVMSLFGPALVNAELNVVIVGGLGGDETYTRQFADQVAAVVAASETMTGADRIRVFPPDTVTRRAVLDHFAELREMTGTGDQVAVYLIGHGSYDDHEYKFNIAGPDLTGEDLGEALNALPSTNQLLVNTSSASGAIAELLEDDSRLLILATRSGVERHATRFGHYFATALNDPTADLDKNQIISVTEAFQFAERQVNDFFERNDRLATEHPRMEGSRGERFGIARLTARRQTLRDSEIDHLTAERDALNTEIDELRLARDSMSQEDYQSLLLQKMLELAATEDDIENRENELGIGERRNER